MFFLLNFCVRIPLISHRFVYGATRQKSIKMKEEIEWHERNHLGMGNGSRSEKGTRDWLFAFGKERIKNNFKRKFFSLIFSIFSKNCHFQPYEYPCSTTDFSDSAVSIKKELMTETETSDQVVSSSKFLSLIRYQFLFFFSIFFNY